MKKASTLLFDLIKSLSRSEKRYFSLYAQRHVLGEKNNYLLLFEAIARQEVYDESSLRDELAGQKAADYLPVAKHQLYHLILDSLHSFYAQRADSVQIGKWLHQGELLVERGFVESGRKLWEKAKKKALEQEAYEWIPAILKQENRVMARSELGRHTVVDLDAMMDEELAYLDILKAEATYWHLLIRIYRYHHLRGTTRDEEERNHLQTLIQHPLLQDEARAVSFTARLYFYQIWGTYHFVQGDMEQAYHFNRKRIDLFHDAPAQIQRMPDRYLSAMHNFLVDCLKLGWEADFRKSLDYIRALANDPAIRKVPRLPGEIFRLTYMLELNQHVNAGHFLRGMELIPEVERGLEHHHGQITAANRTIFYYLIAYTYFGVRQYSPALRWLNRLLQTGEKASLQHIHATARLFNLILHYEMGNLDLLEGMIRSTQRYLQHIDELYELESLFIRAFRQVINAVSERETQEIWRGLREGIQAHADDPAQNQLLQYFDFQGWLQAKISGQMFGEI